MFKFLMILLVGTVCASTLTPLFASSSRRDIVLDRKKQNDRCRNNLTVLYGRLSSYATKNEGALPNANNAAGLLKVVNANTDYKHFLCNASRLKKIRHSKDLTAENIPYIYFGGINLTSALKRCPQIPLVADRPDSRHCFVLLADGSVIELEKNKTKRKISNCLDLIEVLNGMYKYPADVLDSLRIKAKSIDNTQKWK